MEIIDNELLSRVSEKAKVADRLRMNYNFHDKLDAPAQRLLNALEPGTVLPIHRHWHSSETYILLKGRIKVMFYDDDKNVTEECQLNPQEGKYGVHIPIGQWHTLDVLESNSVLFEVKDGPYTPLAPEDVL